MLPTRPASRPARRGPATIALLGVAGLVLTGCAASGTDAESDDGASFSPTTAIEEGAYPVTLQHAFGETVITEEPLRVVTIGIASEDTAVALGVVPIAVPNESWAGDADGYLPWFRDAVEELGAPLPETVSVSESGELDFEQIFELQPDLILAPYSDITELSYDRLEQIAPTVAYEREPWGIDSWQAQAVTVGAALGRPAQTAELIEAAEARIAAEAAAHPEFAGATFAYGVALNEGSTELGFYDVKDGRVTFTEQLGLTLAPDVAEISAKRSAESWYGSVSLETLDTVEADLFIAWANDESEVAYSLAQPLLARWAPVAGGHDIWVTDRELARATTSVSVLSMDWALERYVPLLSAAAK